MTSAREAAAQVFVEDLGEPTLQADQVHHLARVLRLRAGEAVVASDGEGSWRICRFDGARSLDPEGPVHVVEPPERPVTVGVSLVKGGKLDLVVQKLTELGVDHIVPFHSARSVVRWNPDRATKHLERLRRVAEESCAQCRRMRWPRIGWPATPSPAAGSAAAGTDTAGIDTAGGAVGDQIPDTATLVAAGAVLADGGGGPLGDQHTFVLIGPEGGWDDRELIGAERVELAPLVLRADTAAITAAVLLGLRHGEAPPRQ